MTSFKEFQVNIIRDYYPIETLTLSLKFSEQSAKHFYKKLRFWHSLDLVFIARHKRMFWLEEQKMHCCF